MKTARHRTSYALLLGLMALATAPAFADTFWFDGITNNNAADVATGEAQLSVDVTGSGNQAVFRFHNAGPNASSICDIYFEDGTLLGMVPAIADSGTGVSFSLDAKPKNLPGGNTVGFRVTKGFSADSDPPVQPMGVNPGEWVEITFNLINGFTYQDTIRALNGEHILNRDGILADLRIGIHVQGFLGGGSESFISKPNPAVPLPATAGAALLLLGGFGLTGRRRTRQAK